MPVTFWYLLILTGSQLGTCWGSCSVYDKPSREEIAKCQKLLKVLKEAVVNDEDNMFILRDVFTSTSHPPPSLLDITYNVYLKKNNAFFLNSLRETKEGFNITFSWSNSQIFTIINPYIIFTFQPAMLRLAYIIGEGLANIPEIFLHLHIPEDFLDLLNPDVPDFLYSFSIITEQLQSIPSEQKEVKKGFAIPFRKNDDSTWDNYTIMIVISTIILVITGELLTMWYVKVFSSHIRDNTTYNKINNFWSFMIVVTLFNVLEIYTQVSFIVAMLESKESSRLLSIKLILLGLEILSMIMGIGFGYLQRLKEIFPLYLLHLVEISELPSNIKPLRCIHSLAMCNLFLFVSLVCISFVTTVLITLIFPILTLSLLMYIITSMFCFITIISASTSCGLSLLLVKAGKIKACKVICSQACKSVLYILMFASVNTILLFFLIVLNKSEITNTSSIFQSASSFFPSLILTALGYFTAKFARKKELKDKSTAESETGQPPKDDSLKLAEEGRALSDNDAKTMTQKRTSNTIQIQYSCEQRHGWLIKNV